ncbi:MAG: hypothetical protein AAF791_05550 [Bacteroidota bacterium]
MRFLLLAFVVLAACGPRPDATEADTPTPVMGTVTAVDRAPMAADGDALVTVETEAGETVEVRIPARMALCEADLGSFGTLRAGDRVEVVGATEADGAIRPCTEPTHRLARPGYTTGTFEGAYVAGFETSGFRPCGQPDADWWVRTTEDMNLRYRNVMQNREMVPGRGLGAFVRVTVEGELSPEGAYGSLGGWDREVIVHRVIGEMEFLAPGDSEWPTPECSE